MTTKNETAIYNTLHDLHLIFKSPGGVQPNWWHEDTACRKIESLAKAGSNVNWQEPTQRNSALHIACFCNLATVSRKLIDLGANVNATNSTGMTPLHSSACGSFDLNSDSPFTIAKQLIDAGVDCNAKTLSRFTVCHYYSQRVLLARALEIVLKSGRVVDIDAINEDYEWTALLCAMYHRNWEAAKLLLVFGASVDVIRRYGKISILLAAQEKDVCLESLVIGEFLDAITSTSRRSELQKKKRELAQMQFEHLKPLALTLCVALQSLSLPALVTLAIVDVLYDCAQRVAMHKKWSVIVAVKHFNNEAF